jgi:hypothetical protein
VEKRSRRINPMVLEQRDIKDHFCVTLYCSVQPRPLAVDFDSGLVDRDPPRLRLRWVRHAVSQPMFPLKNRLKRAFYAEWLNNRFYSPERQTGSMESDDERQDGRRRSLPLPTFEPIFVN